MSKYDNIEVRLADVAEDGLDVIGRVRAELRRNGVDPREIHSFTEQALFGDYSHLTRVCTEWVRIS